MAASGKKLPTLPPKVSQSRGGDPPRYERGRERGERERKRERRERESGFGPYFCLVMPRFCSHV
jgi:hypothetical protein